MTTPSLYTGYRMASCDGWDARFFSGLFERYADAITEASQCVVDGEARCVTCGCTLVMAPPRTSRGRGMIKFVSMPARRAARGLFLLFLSTDDEEDEVHILMSCHGCWEAYGNPVNSARMALLRVLPEIAPGLEVDGVDDPIALTRYAAVPHPDWLAFLASRPRRPSRLPPAPPRSSPGRRRR